MPSQKKSDPPKCIKCHILLTDKNWLSYLKPRSNYICTTCFRKYGKTYYKNNPDYSRKQNARYHSRKSAVIHAYGDSCTICGEENYYKLTIDRFCENKKLLLNNTNIYEQLFNLPVYRENFQVLCYNCFYNKNTMYFDTYSLEKKKKIIEYYGNQCINCSEDRIKCLFIKKEKTKYYTGVRLYRWIIKHNYPDNLNFQIICANCREISF